MEEQSNIQLHFLPDTYASKEAAQAAARKFAFEKLGMKNRRARNPSDLAIWLR